MVIQPITTQDGLVQCFNPFNSAQAYPIRCITLTFKRLRHPPLRARIEERQLVTLTQRAFFNAAYLENSHVEFERRRAAVVDEQQIRVQLHVSDMISLHGAVGLE